MKTSELALLACVLLAFATQASPGLYEDRSFSVTGTNFFFKFQDTGLDTSNMTRIAEDIIAIYPLIKYGVLSITETQNPRHIRWPEMKS